MVGYADSDYPGDKDARKSTSGYVFMLSGGVVSWSSKKHSIVMLSTTEAEFVAAAHGACQGVWLRNILKEIGATQFEGTALFVIIVRPSNCPKIQCYMVEASTFM